MSRIPRKILFSIAAIILFSVGLILTGMGNDKVVQGNSTLFTQTEMETPATPMTEKADPLPDTGSLTGPLVKLILALGIVIAAIYGFLFLLRKMMGQKLSANNNGNLIEVVETAYIAQKRSVSVIRFHDRAVLVGISESSMQRLAELSPEETQAILSEKNTEVSSNKFAGVLSEAKSRLKKWNMVRMASKNSGNEIETPQTI